MMNIKTASLTVLLFFILAARSSFAATYCVQASGTNGNDGLAGSGSDCTSVGTDPWQTISKIESSSFSPGDNVKLACAENFDISADFDWPSSGEIGTKIQVPGWSTAGNWHQLTEDLSDIWYVDLADYPFEIYLNSSSLASDRARYSWDVNESNPWVWDRQCKSCPQRLFVYSPGDVPPSTYYTNMQMHDNDKHIRFQNYGSCATKPSINCINPISGWDNPANWTNIGGNTWIMAVASDPRRLRVNGSEVLSADRISGSPPPAEYPLSETYSWFWQSGTLYKISAGNPASTYSSFTGLADCQSVFNLGSKNYILIEGIEFRGGQNQTVLGIGNTGIIFKNNQVGYGRTPALFGATSSPSYASITHSVFQGNVFDTQWAFPNDGYDDVSGVGEGLELRHGADKIYVLDNYFLNIIHSALELKADSEANAQGLMNIKAVGNFFSSEETFDGRPQEVRALPGKTSKIDIYYNWSEYFKTPFQYDGSDVHVHDNIYLDNANGPYKAGSTTDVSAFMVFVCIGDTSVSDGNLYEHNLLARNQAAGFAFDQQSSSSCIKRNHRVLNNIIYDVALDPLTAGHDNVAWEYETGSNVGPNTVSGNLAYNNSGTVYARYAETNYSIAGFNALNGTNGNTFTSNLEGDPLFVDPDNNNFYPSSLASPAIAAGVPGVARFDWDGNLRPLTNPDIGPFQSDTSSRGEMVGVISAGVNFQ